jgi:hypothetical protein
MYYSISVMQEELFQESFVKAHKVISFDEKIDDVIIIPSIYNVLYS